MRQDSVFRVLRQGAGKVLRHRSGGFTLSQRRGFHPFYSPSDTTLASGVIRVAPCLED